MGSRIILGHGYCSYSHWCESILVLILELLIFFFFFFGVLGHCYRVFKVIGMSCWGEILLQIEFVWLGFKLWREMWGLSRVQLVRRNLLLGGAIQMGRGEVILVLVWIGLEAFVRTARVMFLVPLLVPGGVLHQWGICPRYVSVWRWILLKWGIRNILGPVS